METLCAKTTEQRQLYFIPSDGDDPAHPNVFQLPSELVKSRAVLCGDVKDHFPLPGKYHFRFKQKFKDAFVWVDMVDARAEVPSFEGVYTAKVARLSGSKIGGAPDGLGHGGPAVPPPMPAANRQGPSVGGVAAGVPAAGVVGMGGGGEGMGDDDLLNMGHGSSGAGVGGSASQGDDLLGMDVFDRPPVVGAGAARAMPSRSPTIPPPPMGQMPGGVGIGSYGVSYGSSMGMQWQQQQQQKQAQQSQNQYSRFSSSGMGGMS